MAMAMRSDKLKLTLFQAAFMHAKLTMLFAFCVLLPGQFLAASSAAPSPVSEAASSVPVAGAAPQAPTASSQPRTPDASQPPAVDDAALTAPDLGRAFEAFQPSEAISADNAVPFPTNI